MKIRKLQNGDLLLNQQTAEIAEVTGRRYGKTNRLLGVYISYHNYQQPSVELGVSCFTNGAWQLVSLTQLD